MNRDDVIEIFGVSYCCFRFYLAYLQSIDANGERVFGRVLNFFELLEASAEPRLFVAIRRLVRHHIVVDQRTVRVPILLPRTEQQIQVFPLNFEPYGIEIPDDVFISAKKVFLSCTCALPSNEATSS